MAQPIASPAPHRHVVGGPTRDSARVIRLDLVQDEWLTKSPERVHAWVEMLLRMDVRTGAVDTSALAARRRFRSRKAWRHYIDQLERRGYLHRIGTRARPHTAGRHHIARVVGWQRYVAAVAAQP